MLIELLRLLPGYVSFEAKDGFPDRFLNLCTLRGITLWNVRSEGGSVKGCTSASDYKKIRIPAHRSGMRVRICEKHGLPFFLHRNRNRAGAAAGLLLLILFISFMSGFVWSVQVTGNQTIGTGALLTELKELGVKSGTRRSKIDAGETEKELLKAFPSLIWATVNILGGKVTVEVREAEKAPDMAELKQPANLIAAKDGQIVLVEGFAGTNSVHEKDVVVKGDLLISGVIKNADGSEHFVHAAGKVLASTVTDEKCSCGFTYESEMLTKHRLGYSFSIFGLRLPLNFWCRGSETYDGSYYAKGGGSDLPVGTLWQVKIEKEKTKVKLTSREAAEKALLDAVQKQRSELESAEIKALNYQLINSSTGAAMQLYAEALENIAVTGPLSSEDNKEMNENEN